MNSRQSKKGPRSVTEADDKNAKHRKIDVRVVATEKEKMIFQRRLKNCQTTTNRLLANANHVNPVGTSSKLQDDLTIGASCSSSKLVTERATFSSLDVFRSKKDVIHPFHVFEKGSTSGIANDLCTPILDTPTTKETMQTRGGKRMVIEEQCDDEGVRSYIEQLMDDQNYFQAQTHDGQSNELNNSADIGVHQNDDSDNSEARKVCGPTLLKKIWKMPPGKTIDVQFNSRNNSLGKRVES
ncbi:uncharacterized protein LOC107827493 isoform X2 [Nicotiana tabacum]|uniref:Uncharacterized protein LOC107827493 isoform X2 n=2 Tax=Nicotiana tabacum TaxID=4097 RepID=A0AC58S936_TOBAC|nr:PREDICTED: uncharacterized protein LOC107827493 isoform X2 [Nicotiana tabacum]